MSCVSSSVKNNRVEFRAIGSNPNWEMKTNKDKVIVTLPGKESREISAEMKLPAGTVSYKFNDEDGGLMMYYEDCSDSVTGKTYKRKAVAFVEGVKYQGCVELIEENIKNK